MTLEDAIKRAEDVAENLSAEYDCYMNHGEQGEHVDRCLKCAAEHRQLAKWLNELKAVHDEIDDADDEDEIFIGYLREKMRDEE